MAQLLPFDTCCAHAQVAAQNYYEAVQKYRKARTRANWQKVVKAYSDLSGRQYELEHHQPAVEGVVTKPRSG